jgi:hypothetical protein
LRAFEEIDALKPQLLAEAAEIKREEDQRKK